MTAAAGGRVSSGDLFSRAVVLHRAGRFDEADRIYSEILDAEPRHFDALHLHGVIAWQKGANEAAVRLLDQALAIDPHSSAALSHRGSALKNLARFGGRWRASTA